MTLTGKGYYIWIVRRCENGDPDRIAALAREANLSHVILKIADGSFPFNIDLDSGYDYAKHTIKKLQAQNIAAWGYQYIYGDYPMLEAEMGAARAHELGLDGFIINAEDEYKSPAKAQAASQYMNILRNNLGSLPIALSSYRYPSFHAQLPWKNFLERCDYNMPQVYWMRSNNPGAQLQRCVNEFKAIEPYRPIIPTGSIFKEHGWVPKLEEVVEFFEAAKQLKIPAVNFWSWDHARLHLPKFWDLVRDYQYDVPPQEQGVAADYINAMNSRNAQQVLAFYVENAIHIRKEKAIHGKPAILDWVSTLLRDFPDGTFSLMGQNQTNTIHSFQWEMSSQGKRQLEGRDTIGLTENNKINFHYSLIKHI